MLGRATRKVVVDPRGSVLSARLALWVVLVSVLARATSLPRAQRIASLGARPRRRAESRETAAHLARTLDALLALDVLVFRPRCWKRAMVLHRFLALNAIESRINFGVQTNADGTLHGHAWLERDGQPFLEQTPGAYIVTFSLPLPRGAAATARP